MKAINKTRGCALAERLAVASGLFSRMKGLMGRKSLPDGEGMLLSPCTQIHTFFMKFSIDVLFLDRALKVLHLINDLRPYRFSALHLDADSVMELPAGKIRATDTQIGDILEIKD